jgi:antirestriction protein ArdC
MLSLYADRNKFFIQHNRISMKTTAPARVDVYQIITDRIMDQLDQLDQHKVPWRQPWFEKGPPTNLATKRRYHGINVLLLSGLDYESNYFLSWNQIKTMGGSVQKGEKGHLVVFWKRIETKDEILFNDEDEQIKAVLRYYIVFNVQQCTNIPPALIPVKEIHRYQPVESCEEIITNMPLCPRIEHNHASAFYNPRSDYINMPKQTTFESIESYYSTLFHELVHSTGHPSRINRKEIADPNKFGSDPYSIEELTAEIGTTFLQSVTGIQEVVFKNSVSYISNWLQRLKNDKKLIVYASSRAQKAVDFMLNIPSLQDAEVKRNEQLQTQ